MHTGEGRRSTGCFPGQNAQFINTIDEGGRWPRQCWAGGAREGRSIRAGCRSTGTTLYEPRRCRSSMAADAIHENRRFYQGFGGRTFALRRRMGAGRAWFAMKRSLGTKTAGKLNRRSANIIKPGRGKGGDHPKEGWAGGSWAGPGGGSRLRGRVKIGNGKERLHRIHAAGGTWDSAWSSPASVG